MDNLLIKYLLGEATTDEAERVDQWLSANQQNKKRYEQFKSVWEISKSATLSATPDPQEALLRLRQRLQTGDIDRANTEPIAEPNARIDFYKNINRWRIAALLAGVLFAGTIMYLIFTSPAKIPVVAKKSTTSRSNEQMAAKAGNVTMAAALHKDFAGNAVRIDTLPDKSIVTLNKNASIEYVPGLSGGERTIQLHGEAFFSVVYNSSRPFVVHVNDITVTDLGTSFNILGTPGRTEIVVETGTVMVSRRGKSLELHAGGKVVAWESGKLKKEISKDKLYSYYLGRPLVCDSVPLKRLVEILNEDYETRIIIGKKELESLPITTTFPHKESLNNILAVICATFDISAVRENQSIVLK